MQGSEEKESKNTARIERERETWQTRALTTTSQRKRCQIVTVPYLTRVKEKKKLDGKYMGALCKHVSRTESEKWFEAQTKAEKDRKLS